MTFFHEFSCFISYLFSLPEKPKSGIPMKEMLINSDNSHQYLIGLHQASE